MSQKQLTLWDLFEQPAHSPVTADLVVPRVSQLPPTATASHTPASIAPASIAPASIAPASIAPASIAPASIAPASIAPSTTKRGASPATASASFESIVRSQLALHGIRVRKWRRAMTGVAWYVTYRDGRVQRLIEAPRPKTPISMAIFLHEIGHHAIGFNTYKPRCLEEFHAWKYALDTMNALGVPLNDAVRARYRLSMQYAVSKALRRGIRSLPVELMPFVPDSLSRAAFGGTTQTPQPTG